MTMVKKAHSSVSSNEMSIREISEHVLEVTQEVRQLQIELKRSKEALITKLVDDKAYDCFNVNMKAVFRHYF